MKKTLRTFTRAALVAATALIAMPISAAEVEGWGDFKLYLDPGHSGRENRGLYSYSEAEKTLRVAHGIRAYLLQYTDMPEENIKLCRETDDDVISLEERSDEANAWGADFFYSIHSDASATQNTIVTLFGGWTVDGVNVEKTPNGGKAYGEFLEPNLSGVMRIGSRGNRYDRDFYMPTTGTHENQYPYLSVNRRTLMPSLLSEGGYHTIAEQQSRNINDDYKRLESFAAFQSILQYRGLARPAQTFLTGVVSNSETGQALNGATVTVGDKTYTTDTYESTFSKYTKNPDLIHNGFYLFESLEAGQEVEVSFSAPGFETATAKVTVKAGGEHSADYVTFLDMALTNASPAIVSSISLTDIENVQAIYPLVITFSRNMDRQSVEEAFSINHDGKVTLEWQNDYTLSVDLSKLQPLYDYTITIDGSKARNNQTNQLFDGDADGVEGGDYTLTFTMAEPDVTAPSVISTYPAAEGTVVYTMRPPIRVEFDEIIDWNEDAYTGWFEVEDSNGKTYSIGHVTHSIIAEASVLHCYLAEDLDLDCAVRVHLKPVKDLYGNATDDIYFRFLSEYRARTSVEPMFDLVDETGFWAPGGSGSSAGLTEEGNVTASMPVAPVHGENSSMAITYCFDMDAAAPSWMIRDHNPGGNSLIMNGATGVITMWVYGDASQNETGVAFRNRTLMAIVKKADAMNVDFRGWNLYSWNLDAEPAAEIFTSKGATSVGDAFYLDAIYIDHNWPADTDPVYDPEEEGYKAWTGTIAYNRLERSTWDDQAERMARLTDISLPNDGVENVAVDADNAAPVYYDLRGVRVDNPAAGLYIKVAGNKASKVMIK